MKLALNFSHKFSGVVIQFLQIGGNHIELALNDEIASVAKSAAD